MIFGRLNKDAKNSVHLGAKVSISLEIAFITVNNILCLCQMCC